MDHLIVLQDTIGRLREEIADIHRLNQQFRRHGAKAADAQVAHGRRNERLQAIQHELVRLSDLARKVVSTEYMRENHRSRLHRFTRRRTCTAHPMTTLLSSKNATTKKIPTKAPTSKTRRRNCNK